MKKTFFFAALAGILTLSCNKVEIRNNPEDNQVTDPVLPVSVHFKGLENMTKATSESSNEESINSLKVVMYRVDDEGEKTFESFYTFDSEQIQAKKGTVYIDGTKEADSYFFAAYVNRDDITAENYDKDWALFSNESADGFQMYGYNSKAKDDLIEEKDIDIDLSRHCSKVSVNKISLKWKNSANALKTFKIKGMYLMDTEGVVQNLHTIPDDTAYDWFNKNGYTKSSQDALLYDLIDDVVVSEDKSYTDSHIFYGYLSGLNTFNSNATWNEGGSRLVIVADFDGRECFYAVKMHKGESTVLRNKHYVFEEIIITKPGADHPYSSLIDEEAVTVTFTVQDWDLNELGSVTVE